LEYNLASANNVITGKALVLKSFTPGGRGRDMVQAAHLQYSSRRLNVMVQEEYVGRNYTAEVGYVPRNGYFKINPMVGQLFFPKGGRILSHGPRVFGFYFFNEALQKTDYLNYFQYTLNFRNQSQFSLGLVDEYVKLLQPFDPTNVGKDTLARGSRHYWKAWRTEYVSKPQSVLTYAFNTRMGNYYAGGKWLLLGGEVGYRFQPFVSLRMNASYNNIRLPHPWNTTTFWLVGTNMDVTLTNTLFFSTFVQYNQQTKNINLNSRFQWRYKPASDIFLVYTDNYFPAPFAVRNRALVLKATYWWNK
jgi:hypothetical protein